MEDYVSILATIQRDERYQRNLDWGKPRSGHPEGTVRAHISELERNLQQLRPKLSDLDCSKLVVLIHVHDSFKADAKSGIAISDPRSHASLARSFLAEFCSDPDLQTMVQLHDEPYALWRQAEHGRFNMERFTALLNAIKDWNLFLAFLIVDGCTEGKGREPLHWIFAQVAGKVTTVFSVEDFC